MGSSLMVSLPKDWTESAGLDKGSEVEVGTWHAGLSVTIPGSRPARELMISYPLPSEENIAADITGGYLLGYDTITVQSARAIPGMEREKVRDLTRRFVGMEITEESSAKIQLQFLPDAKTLSPGKILRRMSAISVGMLHDVLVGLAGGDRAALEELHNRDLEVNRQYFLLVRLIRSTLVDTGLAAAFNLENIDILDYRIAAHLLENGGDDIVELGSMLVRTRVAPRDLRKLYEAASDLEDICKISIDSFVEHDRPRAIEAISAHKYYQAGLEAIRGGSPSVDLLDLIYRFERIGKAWADITDLVKPVYS